MGVKIFILLSLIIAIKAQSVEEIKLDIKNNFDEIIQEKNKEILVISEKIRQFVVPFFEQYNHINSFILSCNPPTLEVLTIKNLISSAAFEFKEIFQNDLIDDILSEVIISIGSIQDFINHLKITNNNENLNYGKCLKQKFTLIFKDFIDSIKDASNENLIAMRDDFLDIGIEVQDSLNNFGISSSGDNGCEILTNYLKSNFILVKDKLQSWREKAHNIIDMKIEAFQIELEALTLNSIDKFNEVLLTEMAICE